MKGKYMKKALITGITGQDGSYLAEFLLSKGYEIHGLIRRSSSFNTQRIDHIYVDPHDIDVRFFLHHGDLTDSGQLVNLIYNIKPDEVYQLGAQSHVRVSFDMPEYTGNVTGLGATRLLDAIERSGVKTRFYQASSSEMFGGAPPPQGEKTIFYPRSPYAAAKVYAYWMTVNYREGYNLFACNGILFNHESPRRGETFVTRKVTMAITNMLAGNQKKLYLGNMKAKRDWGFAPEYVVLMWTILQQDKAEDYVIGTGESYSVRDFVLNAFYYAGVEIEFRGEGIEEKGIIRSISSKWDNIFKTGDVIVEIDPRYFRPTEVEHLEADISKARQKLGWEPKINFKDLIKIMVDYDMKLRKFEPVGEGINISKRKGFGYTNHDLSFMKL